MSDRIPFRSPIRRLKTLPVLPTLLTAGNLACGVTAIMCAARGIEWLQLGAILIFVGMVCDMLDGKVARLTKTEGAFGAELDSLSDVVSFGVAPAMLVHRLVLGEPGVFAAGERLIWLVTIFYCVMAAIRLAKYNVEHDDGKAADHFSGIPSPGAAALICSWLIFYAQYMDDASSQLVAVFKFGMMAVTLFCGLLMVSSIPFPHIGNTLFGRRLSFRRLMLLFLCIFLLAYRPALMLAIVTSAYVLYGFIPGLVQGVRGWVAGRSLIDDEEEDVQDITTDESTPKQSNAG